MFFFFRFLPVGLPDYCLSVCLFSVSLFIYLSLYVLICLFVRLASYVFVCPYALFLNVFKCLGVCLFVCFCFLSFFCVVFVYLFFVCFDSSL